MTTEKRESVPGWTIPEAIRRTARRGDWNEYRSAVDATFGAIAVSLKALSAWYGVRMPRWDLDIDALHEALDDPEEIIDQGFRSMMAGAGAASFWRVTSPGSSDASAQWHLIPPKSWNTLRFQWENSTAFWQAPGAARVVAGDVRITPWLHLPGAAQQMAGLPLAEAFRRFVRQDGELVSAINNANACFPGEYSCQCSEVLAGYFTATDRLWPTDLADYDFAVEWMDALPKRFAHLVASERRGRLDWLAYESAADRRAYETVKAAERIVRDRVERFLAPLKSGALRATGHLANGSDLVAILPGIWCRPLTRIDFVNGDILTIDPDRLSDPPQRMWSALTIEDPSSPLTQRGSLPSASVQPPATQTTEFLSTSPASRSRGGAPERYLWSPAVKQLEEEHKQKSFGSGMEGAKRLLQILQGFDPNGQVPNLKQATRHLSTKYSALWDSLKQT